MRARSLRWLAVFGLAAIALGAFGYSVVLAQAVEKIPDEELPEGVKNAGDNTAPGWTGSGEHPGKKLYDSTCGACHKLSEVTMIGPGFTGLYQRIQESHPDDNPYEVVFDFVMRTETGGVDKYDEDPYFRKVQEEVAGPGVQMSLRGNFDSKSYTERDLYNIIDYIFRFKEIDFVEADYLAQVKLGRSLVSGEIGFTYGGPSCTGCHSIGSDRNLRGANVAPNIADAYVTARRLGKDEKNNYSDGLWEILSGDSAPPAHFYYKDVEGQSPRRPLTEGELKAVTIFFEQEAREVGTEQDSNYLPIFALLVAALGILVLEPSVLNVLFVKEDHEFVDGPYKEEEHHPSTPSTGSGQAHDEPHAEPKPEDKPAEEPRAEEKPAEEKPAETSAQPEEPKPAEEVAQADPSTDRPDEASAKVEEDKGEDSEANGDDKKED